MQTEGYVHEDTPWQRFYVLCSEEMCLQEGCKPQLSWKFSDGQGSKEWITLDDEGAYKCMIMAATRRIQTQVKKESDLEDPDLGHGWWIDLKVWNKVERIEEGVTFGSDRIRTYRGKTKRRVRRTAIDCPPQNACRRNEYKNRGGTRRPEPSRRFRAFRRTSERYEGEVSNISSEVVKYKYTKYIY